MHIKIGFNNRNVNADGIRVYRSVNTPVDVSNLPAPLATIGPTATFYNDETVVKDTVYYYVFEVFKGTDSIRTANIKATAVFYTGPGNQTLKAGDLSAGYYGVVSAADFIDWNALPGMFGLTLSALSSTPTQEWLKFIYKGKVLFIPKQPIGNVSWASLYDKGLVFGVDGPGPREYNTRAAVNQQKLITIKGSQFKVRLMRGLPVGADLTRPYQPANNTPAIPTGVASIYTPESYVSQYEMNGSEWEDLFIRCMSHTSSNQKKENWDTLDAAMAFNSSTSYTGFVSDTMMMEMASTGQVITRATYAAGVVYPGYCVTLAATSALYWRPVLEMV
jgi:hypothetical protein